jgi:hypothetical protein
MVMLRVGFSEEVTSVTTSKSLGFTVDNFGYVFILAISVYFVCSIPYILTGKAHCLQKQ